MTRTRRLGTALARLALPLLATLGLAGCATTGGRASLLCSHQAVRDGVSLWATERWGYWSGYLKGPLDDDIGAHFTAFVDFPGNPGTASSGAATLSSFLFTPPSAIAGKTVWLEVRSGERTLPLQRFYRGGRHFPPEFLPREPMAALLDGRADLVFTLVDGRGRMVFRDGLAADTVAGLRDELAAVRAQAVRKAANPPENCRDSNADDEPFVVT